jgi:hypothetical protein
MGFRFLQLIEYPLVFSLLPFDYLYRKNEP